MAPHVCDLLQKLTKVLEEVLNIASKVLCVWPDGKCTNSPEVLKNVPNNVLILSLSNEAHALPLYSDEFVGFSITPLGIGKIFESILTFPTL